MQYERYHKFGAEELTLSLGGILCPAPNCGQGILVDSNVKCIECPDKIGCGVSLFGYDNKHLTSFETKYIIL